ncbi:MAG: sigma-70 family RNA polymerase sigma factor [Planctomycetes bacterium]|nr:sigma-70 family RNA polymerase sigma factor [Planctomycetota bacterium]
MFAQTTTHATLLAKVAEGSDPGAWREFCDRYGELIRGFARRQHVQPADCDDIVQDVLLALTKSMPGFQYDPARGRFRSYLKTAVLHAIFRRSCQKRGDVPLTSVESATGAADANPEVDEVWEAEWRQYHLRLAMRMIAAEFNEADRAAFDAYAVQGRSALETAETMGMTVDQVYQAKSRILKRISRLIEAQTAEEG